MNLADIFKQAKDVQARANAMQEQLALIEAEGVAGAGMVKLVLNGKAELRSLSIDPSLLKPEDRQIVEDLIVAALNDARRKAETAMQDKMAALTGGLQLPPGFGLS